MAQSVPFTKMHGLGNDFVVVDARQFEGKNWNRLAQSMCDRHFGVGADQLLLLTDSEKAEFGMRLFNTDGFEAEMCGNGVRCIGKYAYERGIVAKSEFSVETLGGIKRLRMQIEDGRVLGASVAMGVPRIDPGLAEVELESEDGTRLRLSLAVVDMGNPHAVTFLDDPVGGFPLEQVGPLVEKHKRFPQRTNFEVANILSAEKVRVRVWERSAGITLACGTGACATVAAARGRGIAGDQVQVELPGGTLMIQWDGVGEIHMTGPATAVFEGKWDPG